MSYFPTPLGCHKARRRPSKDDRHWGHWRWLLCLPQDRYARAIGIWHNIYKVRPRGVLMYEGTVRLCLTPNPP